MNAQEFRKIIEDSEDKLNVFLSREILSECDISYQELINLVKEFLTDEEKAKLFETEVGEKIYLPKKLQIIEIISNDNIKLELLEKSEIVSDLKSYEIMSIVNSLGDDAKVQILHNLDFFQEHNIRDFQIHEIVKTLRDEKLQEILSDKDFAQQSLHLEDDEISRIVAGFENEEIKLEMINLYDFKKHQIVDILKTFSDDSKKTKILKNEYEFDSFQLKTLISSISVDSLVEFFRDNKEYMIKNHIEIYEVTKSLNKEKQLELVSKFENIDLSTEEKRIILATLRKDAKKEIDKSKLSKEYVTAIEIEIGDEISNTKQYGKVIIDLSKDLEIYRGLDKIISINAMEIEEMDQQKILELCEICPQMKINDNIGLNSSTAEEYRNTEKWIESVLNGINEEWSDIQKVAFIDNAIGKKISYTPDFDTEVCNHGEARALWKIINTGYGVCNGIAQVEQYILSKLGIEAEMVSSGKHAFLKLKDIELPTANGEIVKGDTVLDPTWNLTAHRYGARPDNFCRSYEEIRKHDIRDDGTDTECHKNDEALASATLELDEKSLREVFKSIGLADKEGNFPVKELIDKSKMIDDYKLPDEETIKKQLSLLAEYCPEFATCQNSTSSILEGNILNQENLKFNKCVVNRVYSRDDENKRPILYVYVDLPESGKKFYFADKDTKQFIELPQKEFESRFECYEMDMEKQEGHRPWEDINVKENEEDLTRSSGKVISTEGDER